MKIFARDFAYAMKIFDTFFAYAMKNLQDIWRGHAVEQIVGQELWKVIVRNYIPKQSYWIRDKRGSTAEIDFIFHIKEG